MLKWLTRLEHLPVLLEPLKVVELNVNLFISTILSPQHLSYCKLIQIWDLTLHFWGCFHSKEKEPKWSMMFELESDCTIIVEAFLNLNLRIHNSFSVTNSSVWAGLAGTLYLIWLSTVIFHWSLQAAFAAQFCFWLIDFASSLTPAVHFGHGFLLSVTGILPVVRTSGILKHHQEHQEHCIAVGVDSRYLAIPHVPVSVMWINTGIASVSNHPAAAGAEILFCCGITTVYAAMLVNKARKC